MRKSILMLVTMVSVSFIGAFFTPLTVAEDKVDMERMQQQLNRQTMEKPFSVEEAAKIDAYVQDAMKKDIKPREKAPVYWVPGYTCTDLWRRSYYDYRDCAYYYRYYGHYW